VPRAASLAVLLRRLVGAVLGFLWFNAPPARCHGRDNRLAVDRRRAGMLANRRGDQSTNRAGDRWLLFCSRTVSVVFRVHVPSKITRPARLSALRRLHHHFGRRGWSEPTIVLRFWIIGRHPAMIGLATLEVEVSG